MTSKKKDFQLDDFFPIKSEALKVDQPLTFDCFVHLEENQKVIHWMRQGANFTSERKTKLEALGSPPLMVLTSQRLAYLEYIGARETATDVPKPVFGKIVRRESDLKFIKGTPRKPEAKTAAPGVTPKVRVDADFLNAVIKSTVDVFQDQFNTKIQFQPPKPRKEGAPNPFSVDIASFIALTSETIRGTIGLCFPSETYRRFLCQVTGAEYNELTPEMCIGCGEFMSFIYDSVRPRLLELGYMIDQAIPTLIVGKDLPLPHIIPDKGFSITFESPGGVFNFEIGIKTGA